MQYNLFLDDIRTPENAFNYTKNPIFTDWEWVIVRSYAEFVAYIEENGIPSFVAFDHDLADITYDPMTQREHFEYHETTGKDCADWLINYCIDNELDFPDYFVHSANPIGAENIDGLIKSYYKAKERGLI